MQLWFGLQYLWDMVLFHVQYTREQLQSSGFPNAMPSFLSRTYNGGDPVWLGIKWEFLGQLAHLGTVLAGVLVAVYGIRFVTGWTGRLFSAARGRS